ncbi:MULTISPECIES: FAD-dependent monooxygenase [unclassified Bradyrhizobium]|uniref:FAD-dependent monooxygenase n=1 Tax=unclassified Bradyrhizobium TaxID=2631580 RepID=UPI0024788F13|nr:MULTISPECIES: FAD-dependent monooxygenase [unclassified Bradyrhizobium]WGR73801.1 FAD-dependent monooxygenase [Bradyrhizobium sp. ISRA426]WGR82982.1 FAD-dependent monooxygenase [Bradyrhizobium sp. ISRA430]WGR89040.1 FAD-dependent monooxygenase [Bradyrhizobium sp. ISRA432]
MTDSVLVVGAGPVGQTMALELARYGVSVRIIDKMPVRSDKSRAVALWSRTLELLDRTGTTDDLLAIGNKVSAATILAGGRLIGRVDFGDVQSPYPFALMVPQCDTEAVFERHLERFGVKSELGVELIDFSQDGDGVSATIRSADGREQTERFDWLIGCDGAHSPIRHRLGFEFGGDTMGNDWTLGDFHMSGWPFALSELVTYWHEDGVLVFFPMGPGRYRLIASLGPSTGETPAAPTLQQFQALVDRRGPGGLVLKDSLWTTAFRINERQVANYRSGRIFLAGDSAHVHSPAGGQGMNTGMQDAFNLAWKLALVCHGISTAPALLDSYNVERKAVGAAVIHSTGRLTKTATLHNHAARHLRNFVAHVVMGIGPVRQAMAESMTEVSVGYPQSPLNGPSSNNGLAAGVRVPPVDGEAPYGSGNSPRFSLLAAPGEAQEAEEIVSRHPQLVEPMIRPITPGAGLRLVRPDGYLAASASRENWREIAAYLERLKEECTGTHRTVSPGLLARPSLARMKTDSL